MNHRFKLSILTGTLFILGGFLQSAAAQWSLNVIEILEMASDQIPRRAREPEE